MHNSKPWTIDCCTCFEFCATLKVFINYLASAFNIIIFKEDYFLNMKLNTKMPIIISLIDVICTGVYTLCIFLISFCFCPIIMFKITAQIVHFLPALSNFLSHQFVKIRSSSFET